MRRIIILVVAAAIILAMAVSPSFAVRLVNVPEQICAHEKSPKNQGRDVCRNLYCAGPGPAPAQLWPLKGQGSISRPFCALLSAGFREQTQQAARPLWGCKHFQGCCERSSTLSFTLSRYYLVHDRGQHHLC